MTTDQNEELNNIRALLESGAISQTEYDELIALISEKKQVPSTKDLISEIFAINPVAEKTTEPIDGNQFFTRPAKDKESAIPGSLSLVKSTTLSDYFQSGIPRFLKSVLLIPVSYVSMQACTKSYAGISSPELLIEKWVGLLAMTFLIAIAVYGIRKLLKKEASFFEIFHQSCYSVSAIFFLVFPISYILGLFFGHLYR
jgi:hypothetical protein